MPAKKKQNIPEVGIKWSKKTIIWTCVICLILASSCLFGFLFYQEYSKHVLTGDLPAAKAKPADLKNYSNDYWGFKFQYPTAWSQVIGSYQDGEYYFASEPINFIGEISGDQALVKVETYINYKSLSLENWLKDREENYLPQGQLTKLPLKNVGGLWEQDYIIEPKKPQNNRGYLDIRIFTRDTKKIYFFTLQTKDKPTHDRFSQDFTFMLKNLNIYGGFGH